MIVNADKPVKFIKISKTLVRRSMGDLREGINGVDDRRRWKAPRGTRSAFPEERVEVG